MKFSGWKGWGGFDRGGKTADVDENRKVKFCESVSLAESHLKNVPSFFQFTPYHLFSQIDPE